MRYADFNKDFPKKKWHGVYYCRWCDSWLSGRRTSFCNAECKAEVEIRCGIGIRDYVYDRDHSICAKCGRDCNKAHRRIMYIMNKPLRGLDLSNEIIHRLRSNMKGRKWRRKHRLIRILNLPRWDGYKSLWEVHHKHMVKHGGGACGLDNLQTLCLWCHHEETKPFDKLKGCQNES